MNRLADETSPYLLQHAHNPVDWYPWGDEAIERARAEGKPIFLSVGYSACHWCHVMERESFENPEIAAFLNEHFVNVKVDREERPDVDAIYMEAVQVMTGHGGWPMSVFLTPDLAPFFAGTYFPPEDKWGRAGFLSVLRQLRDVWEGDPDKVRRVTEQVTQRLELMARPDEAAGRLDLEPLAALARQSEEEFDPRWGGFGSAPKFPPSTQLRALLHVEGDRRPRALEMAEQTLVFMASGGMWDHVGGGFHRYSTDERWLVPHFEKMLYDNALLMAAYTEAFQVTGRDFYRDVVERTAAWLTREMTDENGGFYSSQDADSEGVEGKFFVWTPAEIDQVLAERADDFATQYDVTRHGNFEGASIPNRLGAVADDWTLAFENVPDRAPLDTLRRARDARVRPATDTKILASWNGLTIGALARASAVFDDAAMLDAARRAADFVWNEMRDESGELHRTYKDGRRRFPGYLDDYAFFAAAVVDLFEATGRFGWLERARELTERMLEHFWDDDTESFFYTAPHHTDLLVRQRESYDGATPASTSVAAMTLLRLASLLGVDAWRDRADAVLRRHYDQMMRMPRSMTEMVQALDLHVQGADEYVCFTPENETSLATDVWREHTPNGIVIDVPPDEERELAALVPAARERGVIDGRPTLYVCHEGACELPRHRFDTAPDDDASTESRGPGTEE